MKSLTQFCEEKGSSIAINKKSENNFEYVVTGEKEGKKDGFETKEKALNSAKYFIVNAVKRKGKWCLESHDPEMIPGGLSSGLSIQAIAAKHNVKAAHIATQVKLGIEVEMEHTNDSAVAREIAMDHLFEDPDYYTKLAEIEND